MPGWISRTLQNPSWQVRKAMGDAAVNAAKKIGYRGVGTIEFLWEPKGFYFMEMNTRIQARGPPVHAASALAEPWHMAA